MFGLFEILGNASKVRINEALTFATIDAGIAHFGTKVIDCEKEGDDYAVMFVNVGAMGQVYTVETL